MPLSERDHRRPEFDEATSAPVVLADGQEWFFPKPWLELRPTFKGGRASGMTPALTCGPEFDELQNAVRDVDGEEEVVAAGATLGAHMLLKNYTLDDEQLGALLAFRDGRPWLRDVMRIAAGGSAPKVSSAGGD